MSEADTPRWPLGPAPEERGYYFPLSDGEAFHRPQTVTELGDGLWANLPAKFVARDVDGFDVVMILDKVEEGIRPIEVRVSSRDTGAPVTGETLRRVRVAELFKIAVSGIISYDPGHEDERRSGRQRLTPISVEVALRLAGTPEGSAATLGDRESMDGLLQRVATMYRAATIAGIPPQKFVLESFEIPRSTAGYWISQARKRGYLAPVNRDGHAE